jgi:hypothetical protein
MSKLDQHRIDRPGRDADKELRDLQRRFTTITQGYERAEARRKFLGSVLLALVAAGVAFVVALAVL